jgi:uncharacterized protein
MKLAADRFNAPAISAYGVGWVAINGERFEGGRMVWSMGEHRSWPVLHTDEISAQDFADALAQPVELVLLGTGQKQRFISPALSEQLMSQGIGLEVMDSVAACRTYNVLASEGRQVAFLMIPISE